MRTKQFGVGIVGCGNISDNYIKTICAYPQLNLIGVTDIDSEKAQAKASTYDLEFFDNLDSMVRDPRIDIVVNLTIHHSHYSVSKLCLENGKHVYSEKPLAINVQEALDLVQTSRKVNRRIACAPANFMGEAQQTALKVIDSGKLGSVRVAFAEVSWGRIEVWHPNPIPFYNIGPLWDVGIYPITLLAAAFGPVKLVHAQRRILLPDRKTLGGEDFHIQSPDFYLALLEFANGLVARLTANFYVEKNSKFTGLEIHGDDASLFLSSWHDYNAAIEFKEFGKASENVLYVKEPYCGERNVDWARGVADLADGIAYERPHRASGEQALHIVEVLEKIGLSAESGSTLYTEYTFQRPDLMEWAK